MPNRNLQHTDWDFCQICGLQYPISELTIQKGRKVCTRTCVDNLDVEFRDLEIERVLDDDRESIHDRDEQNIATGWEDLEL